MSKNSLSIIIPTREQYPLLRKCLKSLERALHNAPEWDAEVLVMDGSTFIDETKKVMEEMHLPHMNLYPVEQWWNFSQINNFAAEKANGEWLLFLNNDAEIGPDFFTKIEPKKDEILGFTLMNEDNGSLQHAGIAFYHGVPQHLGLCSPMGWFNPPKKYEVPAVTFACCLVPKSVFEAVKLDKDFYFGYEDIEFCLRAWEHGYKVYVRSDIKGYHVGQASGAIQSYVVGSRGAPSRNLAVFKSKWPDNRINTVLSKVATPENGNNQS